MSTSAPLARLGNDSGKAPIISYNVPEPTSYSGRNFIELKFGDDDEETRKIFKDEVLKAISGSQRIQAFANEVGLNRQTIEHAMMNGFSSKELFPDVGPYAGLIRLEKDGDSNYKIVSNLPLSPELSQLHPQEVYSAMLTKKSLMIYESTFGSLTYEYVIRNPRLADHLDSSVRIISAPYISQSDVGITSPADGSIIIIPRSIKIEGWASPTIQTDSSTNVPLSGVAVQIDQMDFQPATMETESSWTFSTTLNGGQKITAKANYGDQHTRQAEIKITTATFSNPNDKVPPNLEITSPANGSTIDGPSSRVPIKIEGTASDPAETNRTGVAQVTVKIDEGGQLKVADLQPAGEPLKWSLSDYILTEGNHRIFATAVDGNGNKSEEKFVDIMVSFTPQAPGIGLKRPRVYLIENYRLSSYLGQYGAGRTIKTFSLLPGERTKISMKTYLKTEQQRKEASSILDSVTSESTKDFETTLGKEQSDKKNYQESSSYEISGKAEASWGWGSAEISGGVKGGTNAAREQFAKNVSNCTQKHASKASAKRDVQVNTSFEIKEQAGEETAIERELENINVSRTLNFVFRQMNQEFITLLYLTDVRIAFWDGDPDPINPTGREVPLFELQSLLDDFIKEGKRKELGDAIINQLQSIKDYQGYVVNDLFEEVELETTGEPRKYWRINPKKESVYKDVTGNEITVPGVIMSANKYVMRTDGVIVEALLGQGDALDAYSQELQNETIRSKKLSNDKDSVAIEIIKGTDTEAAKIFEQVFPCCKPTIFSLWPPKDDETSPVDEENE